MNERQTAEIRKQNTDETSRSDIWISTALLRRTIWRIRFSLFKGFNQRLK